MTVERASLGAGSVDLIVNLWRPLSTAERQRAQALIESAERDIIRRYPTVPDRLAAGTLTRGDVADVVTWLVIPVLGGPPIPGARSWQASSGAESRSVTLDAAGNPRDPWVYAPWMVDILEGSDAPQQAGPLGHFPTPSTTPRFLDGQEVYW